MKMDKNVIIVGVVALVIGLAVGCLVGEKESKERYQLPSTLTGDEVGMHGAMSGMMSGLSGKTGDDLDRAFIDEMIVHHEGAVEMAETLLKGTKRPELIKLGNDIISAQTGEIEMMKGWRKGWFGN